MIQKMQLLLISMAILTLAVVSISLAAGIHTNFIANRSSFSNYNELIKESLNNDYSSSTDPVLPFA